MNSNQIKKLKKLLSVLAIAAAVKAGGIGFAPSGWAADVNYVLDDGTAERALGIDPGEDVIWFNTFPVQAGGEVIDSISASYGRPGLIGALNGFPITILLYEDADGGDPFNAVLKTSLTTTIAQGPPVRICEWTSTTTGTPAGEYRRALLTRFSSTCRRRLASAEIVSSSGTTISKEPAEVVKA